MIVIHSQRYTEFFQNLLHQGGPTPDQDQSLSETLNHIRDDLKAKRITRDEVDQIRNLMQFTPETMQGFAYLKPNGYAGCFEIIDRIYQNYHTKNPQLYHWDRYWQNHPAAHAVRNRKQYFIRTIHRALETQPTLKILNVASGPGRDMFELFEQNPDLPVTIHCIEQDERAIKHASRLCQPYLDKIQFQQANALRFSVQQEFDLVWSAGLFDYLHDGLFTKLLRRLRKNTKVNGEIVVGNFSPTNPSQAYMELFDWILIHRSAETLRQLAVAAGMPSHNIDICSEELAINLFLHIHKT